MTAGQAPLSNDYAVVLTFEKISKDDFCHFGLSEKFRNMTAGQSHDSGAVS